MAALKFLFAAAVLLGGVSCSAIPRDNDTLDNISKRATSFWYANLDHTGSYRGYAPDLGNDYTYPVFKAVNPGDGAGIQTAINDADNGNSRNAQWLASQPRVRVAHLAL